MTPIRTPTTIHASRHPLGVDTRTDDGVYKAHERRPLCSIGRCSNGHGSKRARLIGGKCRLCREAGGGAVTHRLIISSWIGTSPEAVHYYGVLEGYLNGKFTTIELYYILDSDRCKELNTVYKKQFPGANDIPYRVGMRSNKFDCIDDVVKAGRESSRVNFPKSKMIVVRP